MSEILLKIVNMSISASVIVLVVLLLRLLLKKAPKWITVLLWAIVAVRLACPFVIESKISLMPSAQTISREMVAADDTPTKTQQDTAAKDDNIPVLNNAPQGDLPTTDTVPNQGAAVSTPMAPAETPKSTAATKTTLPVLDIVWASGIAGLLIYAAVSYLRVRKRVATAVLLRENIYQCETVSSPFVLGFIKPKIYLTFNISEAAAEYVIAHERAHIRRLDYIWKPLGFLMLVLHWFNPLVWLSFVLFCKDIELACDERVIKSLSADQRADYSEALLGLSVNRFAVAACPIAFGEVGVKQRIKGVLNYKKPAFWLIALALLAAAVTSVCLLTNPISDNSSDNTTKNQEPQSVADTADPQNQKLLAVLNNEIPFIAVDGQTLYLKSYIPQIKAGTFVWDMETTFTPEEYAFVDLDGDGKQELVANGRSDIEGLKFILKEESDKIYGHSLLGAETFKQDGTFREYYSSDEQIYKTLVFNKTDCTELVFAEYVVYDQSPASIMNTSTIDGVEVSYEQIEAFVNEWQMRPDVVWTKYTGISDGKITVGLALEITKDVLNRKDRVLELINGSSDLIDKNQYIPTEPQYLLINDRRFRTTDDLKSFMLSAYTVEFAEKEYGQRFNNSQSYYKEYEGKLYTKRLAQENTYVPFYNTLQIVSQGKTDLVVKYSEGQYGADAARQSVTLYLKETDGVWVIDNQSIVLLDS